VSVSAEWVVGLGLVEQKPVGVLALKLEALGAVSAVGLGAVSLGSALVGPAVVVRGVLGLALVVWLGQQLLRKSLERSGHHQ
jgi:hypothetical protein